MAVNLSPLAGAGAQFFSNDGVPLSGGLLYTYQAGTSTPATAYTSSSGITALANPIVLDSAGRVPTGEIWLADGINYKFVLKDSTDVLIATWDNLSGINSNFIAYTAQEETQTATQGQTVFDLISISYLVGTNNLAVFVNGSKQIVNVNYIETDTDTVTFLTGLNVGDVVQFSTASPVASNVVDAVNVSYTPAGVDAVTTNVQAKLRQTVSAKDFGVTADGITDDTVALQNAFDYAHTAGVKLILPVGTIKVTAALTFNLAPNTEGNIASLQGQGQTVSFIEYTGASDITVLTFTGNYNGKPSVGGFYVQNSGASTLSTGIYVNKVYGAMFYDIGVYGFYLGWNCLDINSIKFQELLVQNARTGFNAAIGVGGASYPNLNDFDNCNFLNCTLYGVHIDNGANNKFNSCNISQIGSASSARAIYLTACYGGNGGGFVQVENCYFEGNLGINVEAILNGTGSFTFINNSFNSLNGSNNPTHHIQLDGSALSSGTNFENKLVMLGNTFAALNGLTTTNSAVNLVYGSGGYTNITIVDDNVYATNADGSDLQVPTYSTPAVALNNDYSTGVRSIYANFNGRDQYGHLKTVAQISTTSDTVNWYNTGLKFWVTKNYTLYSPVSINNDGVFFPVQAATASAPTYVKGGVYFDTTLNKLRVGGATGWETVSSS